MAEGDSFLPRIRFVFYAIFEFYNDPIQKSCTKSQRVAPAEGTTPDGNRKGGLQVVHKRFQILSEGGEECPPGRELA